MRLSEIKSIDELQKEVRLTVTAISYDECVATSVRKLMELMLLVTLAYNYMFKLRNELADQPSWKSAVGDLKAILSRNDFWPNKDYKMKFEDKKRHVPKHLRGTNVLENAMVFFYEETKEYLETLYGDDWYKRSENDTIEIQVIRAGCDVAWTLVDQELIPADGLIADSLRVAIYNLWEYVREQEQL